MALTTLICLWPGCAAATASNPHRSTVLLAFVAGGEPSASRDNRTGRALERLPDASVGILSATQGTYRQSQLLLDVTQGARVSYSAYDRATPPQLRPRTSGIGGQVAGWSDATSRATGAPQLLTPGLLAASTPGGAAYVGVNGLLPTDAVAAANRNGQISLLEHGPPASMVGRVQRLLAARRLVVADLPGGHLGFRELALLARTRQRGELILVIQRAYSSPSELLWAAAIGLGARQALTSKSTNDRGLIAAIDVAPTILEHLGVALPAAMRGHSIDGDGHLDASFLRALKARLAVVHQRRVPVVGWLALGWLVLLAATAPSPTRRRWALRVGALAFMFIALGCMFAALLFPSAPVEYLLIVLFCFGLAVLSDRLIGWPRAPLAPAIGSVVAVTVDGLAGTEVLMRSLAGPNPAFGARFYGIGNELKPLLACLVFAAAAGALYPARQGRRTAVWLAAAGAVLIVVEGSARIGAGVGSVILLSAATAVAVALTVPGVMGPRRLLLLLTSPVLGLAALAAIDLATAHGSGHFTGSVLHARSAADLHDILTRRYGAAWDELQHGAMPVLSAVCLAAAVVGVRYAPRLLAVVNGDPAWRAALAAGLTAGVVGTLVEDSGPMLLVVAVFTLSCVVGYLRGRPPSAVRDGEITEAERSLRNDRASEALAG